MTSVAAAASALMDSAGLSKDKNTAKELNDRFLKLLVAQMNNQDPLNPLDNAQVTSQMAQINTVTGINGLNDTVNQLITQFARLESMQAAQLTGRSVLITGNTLRVAGEGANTYGVELTSPADKVTVEVRDAAGALVRKIDLGKQDSGTSRFSWDGRNEAGTQVPAGNYTLSVVAVAGGKEIGATPLVARRVEAVTMGNGSTSLVLAGGGSIAYGDIKQIL